MVFLTLNPGSSSIKYAVFSVQRDGVIMDNQGVTCLMRGKLARINSQEVIHMCEDFSSIKDGVKKHIHINFADTSQLLSYVYKDVQSVVNTAYHTIIRVVHGGDRLTTPVQAMQECVQMLESLVDQAPLHIPVALEIIKAVSTHRATHNPIRFTQGGGADTHAQVEELPWLVFDTQFHTSLPRVEQRTGLPQYIEQELGIRRYGFHGLSHQYVAEQVKYHDGEQTSIISCHLGGGSSICAIHDGLSRAVSMGFGPGTGVMMGTRAGDIDWEALLYMMERKSLTPNDAREILYHDAGVLGLSGDTDLMPDILSNLDKTKYKETLDQYLYNIVMKIGAYITVFDRQPTHLVFTGGIGSGSALIRSMIVERCRNFGWIIDDSVNSKTGEAESYSSIHSALSTIKIITLPTDEEIIMIKNVLEHKTRLNISTDAMG